MDSNCRRGSWALNILDCWSKSNEANARLDALGNVRPDFLSVSMR